MSAIFKKVDTVFVSVMDMDSAVVWYQDVIGLKPVWQDNYITVMATEGETPVTIYRKDSPEAQHPIFNFLTDDIRIAHNHLRSKGVAVEPIIETEVIDTFDFLDPEGNRLNVCCIKVESPK